MKIFVLFRVILSNSMYKVYVLLVVILYICKTTLKNNLRLVFWWVLEKEVCYLIL